MRPQMNESYEPTPIEIWQQCSQIQATWTREEELKRRGAGKVEWLTDPVCGIRFRRSLAAAKQRE